MKTETRAPKWEDAPKEITRRCAFMQEYGDTGTGRTSLALSAPGPIAFLHCSEKIEGIVQQVAKRTKIRMHNFGGPISGSDENKAKIARARLADFKTNFTDAFSWARTIVVDTHTDLWELFRYARFGTLTPKGNNMAFLYAPLNLEWKTLWDQFRAQEKTNVIAIGQIREKYVNDKPTGKMEQAGQNKFHYMADIILRLDKDRKTRALTAEIEKGWFNKHYEGEIIEEDDMDFASIVSMITEMKRSEWAK